MTKKRYIITALLWLIMGIQSGLLLSHWVYRDVFKKAQIFDMLLNAATAQDQ